MAHDAFVVLPEAATEQARADAEDWLLGQGDVARLQGAVIVLTPNTSSSNVGYLDVFERLDRAAVEAVSGDTDMWGEHIEGEGVDRAHPGGRTEHIPSPYPHGARGSAARVQSCWRPRPAPSATPGSDEPAPQ